MTEADKKLIWEAAVWHCNPNKPIKDHFCNPDTLKTLGIDLEIGE